MSKMTRIPTRLTKASLVALGTATATLALAACGSSAKTTGHASAASSSSQPGARFSTAQVSGLGTVVVDGRGRTVYVLTSGANKNVPCTGASGCTKIWPSLPLPGGVSGPTAGTGLKAALLGTTKSSDGKTYPTYNGWLMYEYAADSGPGQASGEGIKSFGGTWYALNPQGSPITASSSPPSSSGGGGYGY